MPHPLEILKRYFGYDTFRPGQQAVVEELLAGHDVLAVMPTGAGKSICYQVPALCMEGITLVVSPLISLMKDQVENLIHAGVPAAYLNSSLTERQFALALSRAKEGRYKIIYVAPERLETAGFLSFATQANISFLAVDEAHCVSQWGQDFRPSYLNIPAFVAQLHHRPMVAAFTATATPEVRKDIAAQLALHDPFELVTGFDRPKLFWEVSQPRSKKEGLFDFLRHRKNESGIVYCATRKNVEEICQFLQERGFPATRYHAGLESEERRRNQEEFVYGEHSIMVATNAFGMGIDKPDVRFVVHYNMPKDLESYYQEAGRAGRDGDPAHCLLLYGPQDYHLNQFLIEQRDERADISDEDYAQRVARDMERLKQMSFYCKTNFCLRRYILTYFGEKAPMRCGGCSNCRTDLRQPEIAAPTRRPASSRTAAVVDADIPTDLMERLQKLRSHLARRASVPAYVIFSNQTLREMCAKQPRDEYEMLRISGVGEQKMKKYGRAFLEVIDDWQREQSGC